MRGKPVRLVAQKAFQFAILVAHHYLRLWNRYEKAAERRWTKDAVARFAERQKNEPGRLITADGIEAVRVLLKASPKLRGRLADYRDRVVQRNVRVFESTVEIPDWDEVPWRGDWRFGHRWPDAFYRQYNFYEFDKPVPYDVHYPWELSRLNFLMIPTLLGVIDRDQEWPKTLDRILTSWRSGNPFAISVNWYPMECAMRGVNLAMLLSLLAHGDPVDTRSLQKLAVLCELHGRFLYRTVENSDVRGNHFAAEIVALLLLGLALREDVPEAERWIKYARRFIEREVLDQYCADGVQFEKSTAYHRLVTQLFLVAFIALEKSGFEVGAAAKQRLHRACLYTRAYTRPDGMAPIWGDCDDARATHFDGRHHRDHRHLTDLAARYFRDESLAMPGAPAIDVSLFLGTAGDEPRERRPVPGGSRHSLQYFRDGGMVCATIADHHFVADVGEVGLRGRGGHGHLDALSFELILHGIPLIVDPGSYIYTGDPQARNRFRSTRAHNIAMVDGAEMAGLFPRQLWRLGNEADPYDVQWHTSEDGFELQARHDGYRRLSDAVSYRRTWKFSATLACLTVQDWFDCGAEHVVERFLHFGRELEFEQIGQRLEIRCRNNMRIAVTCDPTTRLALIDDWISRSYGQRLPSKTLVMRTEIAGPCCLEFAVTRQSPVPVLTSDRFTLTQSASASTIPPLH
jgi:hypothetical protein